MRISRVATWACLGLLKQLVGHITPGDRSYLAHQIMRDRFHPNTRALSELFGKGVLAWKNKQYDVEVNGEAALLRRLKPFRPKMLFDLGANIGDWSLAALEALPDAEVHAFEIAPAMAEKLKRNLADYAGRARVIAKGMGTKAGEVKLYFAPESTTASSMIPGVVELCVNEHNISVIQEIITEITTGDHYVTDNKIERVDFLKIDVEGAEWDVLQGFSDAFAQEKIQMVQFEYGPLNLKTRKHLADYWDFFAKRGFVVGKLFPEGVAFKDFDMADEDFTGPNFIACLKGRTDLIEGLRCEVP
jgi:FkbM family methyltransferase